jgi:hypothetical protein
MSATIKVLVSPGFGAGWSTWFSTLTPAQEYATITDPRLIALAEDRTLDRHDDATLDRVRATLLEVLGPDGQDLYIGGWEDIAVREIPVGTLFKIREYDGSESIETFRPEFWFTAH